MAPQKRGIWPVSSYLLNWSNNPHQKLILRKHSQISMKGTFSETLHQLQEKDYPFVKIIFKLGIGCD